MDFDWLKFILRILFFKFDDILLDTMIDVVEFKRDNLPVCFFYKTYLHKIKSSSQL